MTRTFSVGRETDMTHCELDVVRRRRVQRLHDRYLLRHLPLAYALARRYTGPFGAESELINVATVGLVHAVEEFEPSRGHPFATFAEPLIVAELENHVRDLEHGDEHALEREFAMRSAQRKVADAVARQAHVRDLAGFLNCDVDVLVDGLMTSIERDPHLIPNPAAREQSLAGSRLAADGPLRR